MLRIGRAERWLEPVKHRFRGLILQPSTLQAMWRGEVKISDRYATPGWFESTSPRGSKIIWTRGTDHGHNSIVKYYPGKELVVISLSSSGDPEGPLQAKDIGQSGGADARLVRFGNERLAGDGRAGASPAYSAK